MTRHICLLLPCWPSPNQGAWPGGCQTLSSRAAPSPLSLVLPVYLTGPSVSAGRCTQRRVVLQVPLVTLCHTNLRSRSPSSYMAAPARTLPMYPRDAPCHLPPAGQPDDLQTSQPDPCRPGKPRRASSSGPRDWPLRRPNLVLTAFRAALICGLCELGAPRVLLGVVLALAETQRLASWTIEAVLRADPARLRSWDQTLVTKCAP